MPNCNFNGCFSGSYYPRRVFTSNCNTGACSGARIINPAVPLEFAVFKLVDPVVVSSEDNIPVSREVFSGTAVTDGGNGEVELTAGSYRVSYNVLSEIPDNGEVRTILQLNDVDISTTESVVSGSAGEEFSLSNQTILTLTEAQILTLVNNTDQPVNIISANISVNKL